MDPKGIKLTTSAEAFQLNPDLEKIWRVLWRVDPSKLHKIPEEIVDVLVQIDMDYTVKAAQLTAQMRALEAETFAKISEQINNSKILSH